MKALTKRKKIEILKNMLRMISSKDWDYQLVGLCAAAKRTVGRYVGQPFLLRLGIVPPPERIGHAWWWGDTTEALAQRKRAIREAIKRLEK